MSAEKTLLERCLEYISDHHSPHYDRFGGYYFCCQCDAPDGEHREGCQTNALLSDLRAAVKAESDLREYLTRTSKTCENLVLVGHRECQEVRAPCKLVWNHDGECKP